MGEYTLTRVRFDALGFPQRNGHRLLCEDGAIRAAEIREDKSLPFFFFRAAVRIGGVRIKGIARPHRGDWIFSVNNTDTDTKNTI